jgi:DNA-binding transcriptional LysR family regulator
VVPLLEDELLPAAAAMHPLASRRKLRLRDLAPYAWVLSAPGSGFREHLNKVFRREGLDEPRVTMEVDHASDVVLSMIGRTGLLGVLPHWCVGGDLVHLAIDELRVRRKIALVARRDLRHEPLTQDAVESFG